MVYNNEEQKHARWYSSKDGETYGSRNHMTLYSCSSHFCGGQLFLECVISGVFYNNNNFLLHFSVFWYDGHKSIHHPWVFNKILSSWELHQLIEIHQCFRDWLHLHPPSARQEFTEFCHCENFKTYPRVSHSAHVFSLVRKKWPYISWNKSEICLMF
jgi:hypothetical protein